MYTEVANLVKQRATADAAAGNQWAPLLLDVLNRKLVGCLLAALYVCLHVPCMCTCGRQQTSEFVGIRRSVRGLWLSLGGSTAMGSGWLLGGSRCVLQVKQTVMTSVYGVTFIGARQQISSRLKERGWTHDETIFRVSNYGAKVRSLIAG